MPVLPCYELAKSRSFSVGAKDASLPAKYIVTGTADEIEAYERVLAVSPRHADGLVRSNVAADYQGGGVWLFDVTYSTADGSATVGVDPTDPEPPGDEDKLSPSGETTDGSPQQFTLSFDVSAQTAHVTQSKRTRLAVDRDDGVIVPDNNRTIGLTKDGVAGVDVFAPKLELTVAVERFVTMEYVRRLKSCCGKINGATWWGFGAGEVLYLGATGQPTQFGRYSVTHKFALGDNHVDVKVSDAITLGSVQGWDYVWSTYVPEQVGDFIMDVPQTAYAEQVYDEADFSLLGLG